MAHNGHQDNPSTFIPFIDNGKIDLNRWPDFFLFITSRWLHIRKGGALVWASACPGTPRDAILEAPAPVDELPRERLFDGVVNILSVYFLR